MLKLNKHHLFALLLFLPVAFVGQKLATLPALKLIGALVLALIIGMILQFIPGLKKAVAPGCGLISNKFLRIGIILLGFKLNLDLFSQIGPTPFIIALLIVTIGILLHFFIVHKIFKIDRETALLAACGCSICGAAAVMGVKPSTRADDDEAALAIAVVCILGTVFTLGEIYFFGLQLLNMSEQQFGIWAGASLHEIAHAVAAGNGISEHAEHAAIITKLSRVLLLAPVAFIFSFLENRSKSAYTESGDLSTANTSTAKANNGTAKWKLMPWFMLGFIATMLAANFIKFAPEVINNLVNLAYIFLGIAMAALGFNVNFKVIKAQGVKLLVACFLASLLQAVLALFLTLKLL